MTIVMIGSGNVAAVLGRKLKAAGHQIVQLYSRNASAASELAYEWDAESTNYKSMIQKNADLYIIAVDDRSIDDVADDLRVPGKIVVHTAASVPMEVLKNVSEHYGVLYPLQSLSKDIGTITEIPLFVDGSDAYTKSRLQSLAASISREKVGVAGDDDRAKLHVAAVVVNNFANHLYQLAAELLQPLIEETALRLRQHSPSEALTGPAVRHDKQTIEKHLEILNAHPKLRNIYLLMTESIQQS
jgi:predicted dinucleotide-binding enzyme